MTPKTKVDFHKNKETKDCMKYDDIQLCFKQPRTVCVCVHLCIYNPILGSHQTLRQIHGGGQFIWDMTSGNTVERGIK